MIEFSAAVLEKAKNLSDEDVERDAQYPEIWWVQGNDPDRRYRVQVGLSGRLIQYVTCTCAHGLNTGAGETTCYHVAAVLMRLKEGVEDNPREP